MPPRGEFPNNRQGEFMEYLDFKLAKCKDCFKCLRECPIKAIKYENHQAKIVADKCILCGKCTVVCPQNAKQVHSEIGEVEKLLAAHKVIASVAPSFISNFDVRDFQSFEEALNRVGFDFAEETAVGAKAVTEEYSRLLKKGTYKNLISSACPAINRMIQLYYPKALQYLAPVVSPMVAHAKILKERYPDYKIVFIGPCVAKKREAAESGLIDNVLTYEEIERMFAERAIDPSSISVEHEPKANDSLNVARYYPISRGIIKSFTELPKGYEYVAVDGLGRSFEVLGDIESLSDMFIEINCCEYACINGPCSLKKPGGALKSNEVVRKYVGKKSPVLEGEKSLPIDLKEEYELLSTSDRIAPSEREIREVLAKTGMYKPEDELNCGACGFSTCREKAIAVINGSADVEMCIPYMRRRAESMSYEIIQNSPYGIIVMDYDYKILEYNSSAKNILGINVSDAKGTFAYDSFDVSEFVLAQSEGKNLAQKRIFVEKTKKYADTTIVILSEHKIMFAFLRDVTDRVEYDKQLDEVKRETIETTDAVIKKQMRVAQEIASLLGETTAETKVALLKLKKTLAESGNKSEE